MLTKSELRELIKEGVTNGVITEQGGKAALEAIEALGHDVRAAA